MTRRFDTEAASGGRTHRWARRRTYHHSRFPPGRVAAEREATVSVCLPARNEAATIGPILDCLMPLVEHDVVDQVVVVDDSTDGTGDIARACGAEVYDQSALCGHLGPVQGKGDAMWRALSVLHGDVVCYLDADSERFGAHFAAALAGVVAIPGPVTFAKAFYRRPFKLDDAAERPTGGGRVTELTARPLLKAFFPDLGESASRWPGRSPPAATSSSASRSPAATPWTSPCSSTRGGSSGWTASRRSTSTCARTATARSRSSGRWPRRSCAR
jgi:hypothetical protein